MNKAFGRIENIDGYRQVQVFTNPCGNVTILGYTLSLTTDDGIESQSGITLSPKTARTVLNLLKEWEQFAIEHGILEMEVCENETMDEVNK